MYNLVYAIDGGLVGMWYSRNIQDDDALRRRIEDLKKNNIDSIKKVPKKSELF